MREVSRCQKRPTASSDTSVASGGDGGAAKDAGPSKGEGARGVMMAAAIRLVLNLAGELRASNPAVFASLCGTLMGLLQVRICVSAVRALMTTLPSARTPKKHSRLHAFHTRRSRSPFLMNALSHTCAGFRRARSCPCWRPATRLPRARACGGSWSSLGACRTMTPPPTSARPPSASCWPLLCPQVRGVLGPVCVCVDGCG
jgi:hypothetical protein